MNRRIRKIFLTGMLAVLSVTLAFIILFSVLHLSTLRGGLRAVLSATAAWTADSATDLNTLAKDIARSAPPLRVTFLLPEGFVLADSKEDLKKYVDLRSGTEVEQALERRSGERLSVLSGLFSPSLDIAGFPEEPLLTQALEMEQARTQAMRQQFAAWGFSEQTIQPHDPPEVPVGHEQALKTLRDMAQRGMMMSMCLEENREVPDEDKFQAHMWGHEYRQQLDDCDLKANEYCYVWAWQYEGEEPQQEQNKEQNQGMNGPQGETEPAQEQNSEQNQEMKGSQGDKEPTQEQNQEQNQENNGFQEETEPTQEQNQEQNQENNGLQEDTEPAQEQNQEQNQEHNGTSDQGVQSQQENGMNNDHGGKGNDVN